MEKKLTARAIGLTLTGAVIGAGFASGQEIRHFFVRYGQFAGCGAIVTIMLFVAFAGWLITYCQRHQVTGLSQLLELMAGRRLGAFFLHLLNLFMWFGLTVMLAGSATLLMQLFQLPRLLGALFTAAVVYIVARRQVSGLTAANELLLPMLVFLVLFFLLRSTGVPPHGVVTAFTPRGWLWSALLYLGSNSAIVLATIPALSAETANSRIAWCGVLLAAGLLLILLLTNIHLLTKYAALSEQLDLPLLPIAQFLLPQLPWVYGLLLFIALITTAFANALSLNNYFQQLLPHHAHIALPIVILAAVYVAQQGFGDLVATLYPLTGYLCLAFYLISFLRRLISFDSP